MLASATLAIVLVCFSIYQYSQLDPEQAARAAKPFAGLGEAPAESASGNGASMAVGPEEIQVGPGRRVSFTLYPQEGTRAIGEIEADDWAPIPGPGNQVHLTRPFIRAETGDGRRLNIQGDEAVLETPEGVNGRGGRFDPQRGTLTGSVVIEIDRLTERHRRQLPQDQRDEVDAERLIRVELEMIEFDLEYSRVSVRGPFHVKAYELDFEAADLDVRFDPTASRIETITTREGGRLELRGMGESFGFSLTGSTTNDDVEAASLGDALASRGEELASKMASLTSGRQQEASKPDGPYIDEDGALVLVPEAKPSDKPHEPITYAARFEDEVFISQKANGVSVSQLRADVLRIVRALTQKDRDASASTLGRDGDLSGAEPSPPGDDRVVLSWAGPMSVEAIENPPVTDDQAGEYFQISAVGRPVHVSDQQGQARCRELVFNSAGGEVRLTGTRDDPVKLESEAHGTIVAVSISSGSHNDRRTINAIGPGRLLRVTGAKTGVEGDNGAVPGAPDGDDDAWVNFEQRLETDMRVVGRRGRYGLRTSEEELVLESARFFGGVAMHQGGSHIEADRIELTFDPNSEDITITRLQSQGHVVMTHGGEDESTIACDSLEVEFDPHSDRPAPRFARAFGTIVASNEERTIAAGERMDFVFRESRREREADDLLKALNDTLDAGIDPNTIDWNARRRLIAERAEPVIELARLMAYGDVAVVDPQRELELSAGQLECELRQGNEIHSAVLDGAGGAPASVRSGTFTVQGHLIRVNVDDEWAEVPGPGRISFQLRKDLDGRPVDEPVTVVVTWDDWMRFRGRENRAVFVGNIHTVSDQTTFDCGRLEIEFEDRVDQTPVKATSGRYRVFEDVADQVARRLSSKKKEPSTAPDTDFGKEPTYFLATENVTSVMSNFDEATGRLQSRVSISGPRMSVNLRDDISMMRIEGPGNLLIEDYSLAQVADDRDDRDDDGVAGALFATGSRSASQTLITWQRVMFYDLANERAQFEGEVGLDHMSGMYMVSAGGASSTTTPEDGHEGQQAHLCCNVLSVDFVAGEDADRPDSRRVGAMSARRLKQFRAIGSVTLDMRQPKETRWLSAEELTFQRARQLLFIQGTESRPAEFITQKAGTPPRPYRAATLTVDLTANRVDALNPSFLGS